MTISMYIGKKPPWVRYIRNQQNRFKLSRTVGNPVRHYWQNGGTAPTKPREGPCGVEMKITAWLDTGQQVLPTEPLPGNQERRDPSSPGFILRAHCKPCHLPWLGECWGCVACTMRHDGSSVHLHIPGDPDMLLSQNQTPSSPGSNATSCP